MFFNLQDKKTFISTEALKIIVGQADEDKAKFSCHKKKTERQYTTSIKITKPFSNYAF